MKKRIIQQVEKELIESSHQAIFELLELHEREMKLKQKEVDDAHRHIEALGQENHDLNQTIMKTLNSKSFRLGYVLLHPFASIRGYLLQGARKRKRDET